MLRHRRRLRHHWRQKHRRFLRHHWQHSSYRRTSLCQNGELTLRPAQFVEDDASKKSQLASKNCSSATKWVNIADYVQLYIIFLGVGCWTNINSISFLSTVTRSVSHLRALYGLKEAEVKIRRNPELERMLLVSDPPAQPREIVRRRASIAVERMVYEEPMEQPNRPNPVMAIQPAAQNIGDIQFELQQLQDAMNGAGAPIIEPNNENQNVDGVDDPLELANGIVAQNDRIEFVEQLFDRAGDMGHMPYQECALIDERINEFMQNLPDANEYSDAEIWDNVELTDDEDDTMQHNDENEDELAFYDASMEKNDEGKGDEPDVGLNIVDSLENFQNLQ